MSDVNWHVSTGSSVCPECGQRHVERQQPSRTERVGYRLRYGMRLAVRLTCPNGHEWRASSQSQVVLKAPSPAMRVVRAPIAIVNRVCHGRRMTPVPLTYLLAAGIGLASGVAADVVLDWAWWLVALGVVAAVWGFFVSTAFWGPFRLTSSDLYEAVAPQRALRRTKSMLAQAVASGTQVVYGLSDWPGEPSLAGWGGPTGGHTSVSLAYQGASGRIVVKTSNRLGDRPVDLHRQNLAENLLNEVEQPPPGLVGEAMQDWVASRRFRINQELSTLEWHGGSFLVAGVTVSADWLCIGEATAVFIRLDGHDITVQSHGIDLGDVDLARVESLPSP